MNKNWKHFLLVGALFSASSAYAQTVKEGQRAAEVENYQDAKSIYNRIIKNSGDEMAYFGLGDVYLKTGNSDSAAYYFNQGLSKNPKSAMNMVGLGKLALMRNNAAEAVQQFDKAASTTKGRDAQVLVAIGQAYLDSNTPDVNKGIEYTKRATIIKNAPNLAEAHLVLGDLYLKQNKGGDAMNNYERAIELNSRYAKAYLRQGQLSARARAYTDAFESYQKALQIDPKLAPAYLELGEIFFLANQPERALENFRKYIELAENTPETRAKYASALFLTKDYANTIKETQEVLKTDPSNAVMNRLLAYSYYESNQNEQALAAMNAFFKNVPAEKHLASDFEYYGRILSKAGKHDEAITNLNKALSMDTTKTDLYSSIAEAYINKKDYPKAIEAYEQKVKRSTPTNTDYFYIGRAYELNKNYATADSMYSIITKNNPTFANAHLWRARANANLDPDSKKGLAKPFYEEYIKNAEADKVKNKSGLVEAHSYLGYYYYDIKPDRALATKHWQEVKALEPTNIQATTALKELAKSKK